VFESPLGILKKRPTERPTFRPTGPADELASPLISLQNPWAKLARETLHPLLMALSKRFGGGVERDDGQTRFSAFVCAGSSKTVM
jgi:hypothetical protein